MVLCDDRRSARMLPCSGELSEEGVLRIQRNMVRWSWEIGRELEINSRRKRWRSLWRMVRRSSGKPLQDEEHGEIEMRRSGRRSGGSSFSSKHSGRAAHLSATFLSTSTKPARGLPPSFLRLGFFFPLACVSFSEFVALKLKATLA